MKHKFINGSEKVSFDFRNLPTPMVSYSGTAKDLHAILFAAALADGEQAPPPAPVEEIAREIAAIRVDYDIAEKCYAHLEYQREAVAHIPRLLATAAAYGKQPDISRCNELRDVALGRMAATKQGATVSAEKLAKQYYEKAGLTWDALDDEGKRVFRAQAREWLAALSALQAAPKEEKHG